MSQTVNRLQILALIPARGGSKGIPNKNIRLFGGKPLLAHSIEQARASRFVTRVVVSTDNPRYADIARQFGAEAPFLRPTEIAQDLSTDLETFIHALEWFAEHERYVPDICVHLRPTYPLRRVQDIDRVIEILLERPDLDSVRTVAPAPETPYKMWLRGQDGFLTPVVTTDILDACNLPRQSLPPVFLQNACIDAVRTHVITELHSMTGRKIFGYVMEQNLDIDTEAQLRHAAAFAEREPANARRKTYCFDIDGVLAALTPDNNYHAALPLSENIRLVNALYERGHCILLFTARGSTTGLDWRAVTEAQMAEWGVKYHTLLFGKPAADYYVDDRLLSLDDVRGHAFPAPEATRED